MKTQHTPGPWYSNGKYIEDQCGTIAKVMRPEDNSALIAAAPELLEALETVAGAYQQMFDVMPVAWQTIDNIVASAIAKTKGGNQ